MQFFIPTFLDFLKLREKWPVRQLDCLYVGRSPFAAFAMATKKIEIDSFPHISSFTEINSRERERHDCIHGIKTMDSRAIDVHVFAKER